MSAVAIRTLESLNETLTAAIVIMAASILLHFLIYGLREMVPRAAIVLLGLVTISYVCDVFLSMGPSPVSAAGWLRFQWIGIALVPAAMFQLSDALLATTGLISRWRRRTATVIFYIIGLTLAGAAITSDNVVHGLEMTPVPHMKPGPWFPAFLLYFGLALVLAMHNVRRARRRCLTTPTYRRMTYLLVSFPTPALGLFPYSLLFTDPSPGNTILFLLMLNVGNLGMVLMLAFMAYPLAFFGTTVPDRVLKARLLQFMLRGPVIGVIVLGVILLLPQAGRVLGLPGEEFMPFAAVGALLIWEWAVTWAWPHLERLLIYTDDQEEARRIQELGRRLLTRADLAQLLEAILASVCDYLRAPSAFVLGVNGDGFKLEQSVGRLEMNGNWTEAPELIALARIDPAEADALPDGIERYGDIFSWQGYWLIRLEARRGLESRLVGLMGVRARARYPDLEYEEWEILRTLADRAADALDDRRLQQEVFASLEGLLPEIEAIQKWRGEARYGHFPSISPNGRAPESPDFVTMVKGALTHYWGGPRLSQSPLLQLEIVRQALAENDNNPTRALRAVLHRAIEKLRPEGERSMTAAEWLLYNILDLRFVQGRKVKDVARRLAMSESDLYRKQRVAVEEVARAIADMERTLTGSDETLRQLAGASADETNTGRDNAA